MKDHFLWSKNGKVQIQKVSPLNKFLESYSKIGDASF